MAELEKVVLKSGPGRYQSRRKSWDVLLGEDTALPIIEASSSGDITTLRDLLSQPHWAKVALEKQHTICYARRLPEDKDNEKEVDAMEVINVSRAIVLAAKNNHGEVVSTLLSFALQHDLKLSDVITRRTVEVCILARGVAAFKALATADPSVIAFNLPHGVQPLKMALNGLSTELVALMLELGAYQRSKPTKYPYWVSYLSHASRSPNPRMIGLFLGSGVSTPGSAALHTAATVGRLDSMRLLIQHGADVNEILPAESLHPDTRLKYADWTPMHFAGWGGHVDAMKLLENEGARSDIEDAKGKTPAQLLEQWRLKEQS